MRVLAIDWGERRIGLSISDPSGILVTPLPFIENKGKDASLEKIKKIVEEYHVERIVMGIPKDINGELGKKAKNYKKIGDKIEKETGIPLDFFDERYTTQLAERILREHPKKKTKRKELKDSLSASIILEGYLERLKKGLLTTPSPSKGRSGGVRCS